MIKGTHHTEIDIEIPFHDIDMMEVFWHGHYANYFEISRCALPEKFITTILECLIRAIHGLLFTLESSMRNQRGLAR